LASATITVSQPTQVSISVSPGTATIQTGGQQQFTASVLGTSNTSVAWKATGGTVTTTGRYTAPSTAGTYTVIATSAADSTKSASATITVPQPTQVSISVSPYTANIQTGGQQQFTASVLGTSNTGVGWRATGGTVTTTGLYTAPSTAGTYTVTATSAAITIAAPHAVALTWTPSASTGVTYDVYRGTVTGGPYILLVSGVTGNSYTDTNVQSGSTYYYVTTAATSGGQSSYSNEVQAVIPMP
jgi:hypothetical protein